MHISYVASLDTDSDGRYILTASGDKTARFWDAQDGKLIRVFRPPIDGELEGRLRACALSPDGATAVVGGYTGHTFYGEACLYVFDTGTGELTARIPVPGEPHGIAVWPQPGRYSLGHTGNLR